MALAIKLLFEPMRSLGYASISGVYMGVGTVIDNPARQFLVQNLTNSTMIFSFDGVNDHFVLPANGFLLDDITSNKTQTQGLYIEKGSRLYVKTDGTPTSGSVYFSVMYGSED